jgi:hypothetical protein
MLLRAAFCPTTLVAGSYYVRRASCPVPRSLVKEVWKSFPIDDVLAEVVLKNRAAGDAVRDVSAQGVLETMQWFAEVLLQVFIVGVV